MNTTPKTMTIAERHELAVKARRAHLLEAARKTAQEREGKCMSEAYNSSKEGLDFVCSRGHSFNLRYAKLRNHWCPVCSASLSSRGEALCRTVIEQLTGTDYPEGYPAGLISAKTGRQLSLDMYNEQQKTAFEYHGDGVHFNFRASGRYHDEEKFRRTVEIDAEKKELCGKLGIKLVVIEGFRNYLPLDGVISYVKMSLAENGIAFDDGRKIVLDPKWLCADNLTSRVRRYCTERNG
jgi:hypothetical protein